MFGSNRDGRSHSLYAKRSDGTGQVRTVLDRDVRDYPTQWTPGGLILAWSLGANGVWPMPADGSSEARRLDPGGERPRCNYGNVSPDGRYAAYWAGGEVFVAEIADAAVTQRQVSVDGGVAPYWSREGDELFYIADRTVTAAAIELGDRIQIGEQISLFRMDDQHRRGDHDFVDPLGRGFVFVKETRGSRPPPVVVVNFIEEVKARVGRQ